MDHMLRVLSFWQSVAAGSNMVLKENSPVANPLTDALNAQSKRMYAELEASRVFLHRGETGAVRETIARSMISKFLPMHIAAGPSAEIISVDGVRSGQCDIVIHDLNIPPILDTEDYRLIPNEGVYGIVEVKSVLGTKQLTNTCQNILQIKRMPKQAFRLPGSLWPPYPTAGIIFAFDGISLGALGNKLLKWCEGKAPEFWPNSIWVLGKGFLHWTSPINGNVHPAGERGSGLVAFSVPETGDILLAFALHMNILFASAKMPDFDLAPYLGTDALGTVGQVLRHPTPIQGDIGGQG
jgi:hypothetical protein